MARTYTVHGHVKRRDGRQEAFWTRTRLTKSEADKLARAQRAETGGVAKIVPEEGTVPHYGPTSKGKKTKTPAQLDREIAAALSHSPHAPQRAHATMPPSGAKYAEQTDREIAPTLGKSRAEIVRRINAIVRAADGRNVYLIRERLGENVVRRITRARTKGRGMDVYLLDTGSWLGVMPELGDRIDVR